ncbi:glycosyltransferase [Cetobacterium sp. 8H]|uniref:glycosyltransferase n=1 Tax=Cetobacterium sp. 8H TaxID=2759681 RepID=UPI00163C155F|nr:glycosyltransferase [Cetobacterium sp. 8H]MBC2851070.1 glycosyltransferase [Cetobacterium sp. 8H]
MELTIIVPVYNVEQYLRECLDSIYQIKNIKYEVILVNDGSTDSSYKILEEYKNRYSEITKVVAKENGGLSSARNVGIKEAKGEYISFIDSDDIISPAEFEEFFKEGQKLDLDVMVGNMRYLSDGKIGEPLFRSQDIKDFTVGKGTKFFLTLFDGNKCFREEVVDDIYKRDFICENKLYFHDNLIHEDSYFTPMVYLKAKRIKYIDIAFYYYRQRSGSIMSVVTDKSINSLERICYMLLSEYPKTDELGQKALSKLLPSFYKVVLYRYINSGREYKEKLKNYRNIFKEVNAIKNKNIEEILVYLSPRLVNFLRKIIGKGIGCKQKIPKF